MTGRTLRPPRFPLCADLIPLLIALLSAPVFAGSQQPFPELVVAPPRAVRDLQPAEKAAPAGALTVASEPAGLSVLLDGAPAGTTPAVLNDLAAGPHEVAVEGPCHQRTAAQVVLRAGAPESVRLRPGPRTVDLRLTVHDDSGEQVPAAASLDGRMLGWAPGVLGVPACGGARTLRLSSGDAGATVPFDAAAGTTQAVDVRLPVARCDRTSRLNRAAVITAVGGAVLGGVLFGIALNKQSTFRDTPPGDEGLASNSSSGKLVNSMALVGLGVGAAGLAGYLLLPGTRGACEGGVQ